MNIKIQNCVFLCLIAFLASCSAPKEVLYLQDIASIKEENIDKNYEVIIHKDDLLAILVNSKDPELALPFNMPVVTYQIGAQTTAQQRLLGYLVDQNGDIDFPILGKIHVEGLTRMQVTELIKQKLMSEDLIKDPIVTVQFLNFKVSVMGEVTRPGTFDISGDRLTLLDALSMAGDLTSYGRRDRDAADAAGRLALRRDLAADNELIVALDLVFLAPCLARVGVERRADDRLFRAGAHQFT